MASSSTSESDSLPVSSACKAQRWYESQTRRLNNEGEKNFPRFARTDRHYTPLCTAFRSASPNTKFFFQQPCTVSAPPFNIPRSDPYHHKLPTTIVVSTWQLQYFILSSMLTLTPQCPAFTYIASTSMQNNTRKISTCANGGKSLVEQLLHSS